MEKENSIISRRTHRVGSFTAGFSMVVFGILLLLHTLFGYLNYQLIFSFWPLLLIGMGVELLLSNFFKNRIIYDKAAIFLLILMSFFVMLLAGVDVCVEVSRLYIGR